MTPPDPVNIETSNLSVSKRASDQVLYAPQKSGGLYALTTHQIKTSAGRLVLDTPQDDTAESRS